ncbi:MAG TPA: SDR family oxidoreductase [Dehalococcoidia bacterium]|jgi:3-oxoacyl-[acyl-carrier protein] reductase|nr:SDR family oxidoreductase [Dehalococcoidia bacterium]
METGLKGKIALVTGAGSGLGKAIALGLAREGADVAVNDVKLEAAEDTAEEIAALGSRSMAVQADVADEAEVNRMVARIVGEWGGIDILVNNAGATSHLLIEDTEKAEWDRVLSINLDGAFNCSKAVIPSMKQRGGGRIINIISYSGERMTMIGGVPYTASKAGIWGLTRQLSFELGRYQITVNGISPGNVITPMLRSGTTPERLEEMKKWYPLGDMPTPEDVADAAVFLASSRARMINGVNLAVDGGITVPVAIGVDWETYTSVKKEAKKRESR